MVNVPFFRQRLRSRLLDHPYWRRRSYETAFFCTAAFAGALTVLLTVFVMRPEFPQRLHVAVVGERPVVETAIAPDHRSAAEVVDIPSAVAAESAADLSGLSVADAVALAGNNGGVPAGAVRIPAGLRERELEIVRRLAAVALENRTIDARHVGGIQMREYELNNGQRMMVVDEIRPTPKAVKCVYY